LEQINLNEHATLKRALSVDIYADDDDNNDDDLSKEEKNMTADVIRDEQHDGIMLVQQENVDVSEVVTSMWAHEEDAGGTTVVAPDPLIKNSIRYILIIYKMNNMIYL
jgi:hypothetical protein